ncbi:MAG: monovalent cation/hydrogen antiporter [Thermoleophilaceae bacterium]|jgi:Na+/H+ antiporter|nr:monovalent cation/hydrogen antiporter [Thermoleophilaceae bacterium]MEA2471986.1 monovalent cation/hydrogen antiporter [Thermoleophilaceae bacterium]
MVLGTVLLLIVLADRLDLPYPILLVVGGLGIGFAPGAPAFRLNPDVVLLIVLPPLLYSAAFFSSLRELRTNLRSISLLAIGVVLATMAAVAVVAHAVVPGMSWEASFVLGAIVSPTDPVAASAIFQRLSAPRRVVTVVEGESLINDATALVAYRVAVTAVVTGSFSLLEAGGRFALNVAVGVAIGLAVGWVVARLRRAIDNPPVEMAISISTAYFAYLPAEALHVSGVIAAATVGVYLGWLAPQLISPSTRLQVYGVWEVTVFFLNSFLFVLIGLQLPAILDALSGRSPGELALYGAAVSGVVILTRVVSAPFVAWVPRYLFRRIREHDPYPPWQQVALVAWSGMRGAVSLAAALALPLTTHAGTPFPERDLIVFLTFTVILSTLLLQGLTLPLLIRRLDVHDDHEVRSESKARLKAAKAALRRLEELRDEDWTRDETVDRMRGMYEYRTRRFRARFDGGEDSEEYEARSEAYQRALREVLQAQRDTIVELRDAGAISSETMHRIERDIDLEDSRLEI